MSLIWVLYQNSGKSMGGAGNERGGACLGQAAQRSTADGRRHVPGFHPWRKEGGRICLLLVVLTDPLFGASRLPDCLKASALYADANIALVVATFDRVVQYLVVITEH